MEFRILGPVTVIDEAGASLPLGPPRQHALLAALLLHLGEPMPVDRLIDLLWGLSRPLPRRRSCMARWRGCGGPSNPPGRGAAAGCWSRRRAVTRCVWRRDRSTRHA